MSFNQSQQNHQSLFGPSQSDRSPPLVLTQVDIPGATLETNSSPSHSVVPQFPASTAILQAFEKIVSKVFKEHEERANAQMNEIYARVQRIETNLDDSRSEQIRQCNSINALALGMLPIKKPPKEVKLQAMAFNPSVRRLCSFEVMCKSTIHIVCKFINCTIQCNNHSFNNPFQVLDLLFFTIDAKDKKGSINSEIGVLFKNMKTSMAFSYLAQCIKRAEKENFVRTLLSSEDGNDRKDQDAEEMHLQKPVWTEPGFIEEHHMMYASDELFPLDDSNKENESPDDVNGTANESGAQQGPPQKRRKVSEKGSSLDDQVRHEVCKEIWKSATEYLNLARHDSRRYLTEHLGFLFLDSGGAKWEYEIPDDYFGRAGSIPLAHTYTGKEAEQISLANLKNGRIVKEILAMFPKLSFKCQYTVKVYPTNSARNARRGPYKAIRMERKLCLWDLAKEFFKYYARTEHAEECYRYVAESFRTIYYIAMGFASMLHRCSDMIKSTGSAGDIWNKTYPGHVMIEKEEARLDTIQKCVFELTQKQYNELFGSAPTENNRRGQVNRRPEDRQLLDSSIVNAHLM